MKTRTLTQNQKPHNVNQLHDAFVAASIPPLHVESTSDESRFAFADGVSNAAIQAVVDSYTLASPAAPVNLRTAWQEYKDAIAAMPAGPARQAHIKNAVLLKELFITRDSGLT